MKETYQKHYSEILQRDMELLEFGGEGKVCLAFPPQDGRFYDYPNFGMVDTVRDWIDAGKLRVICPDGIDRESWSGTGDPRHRIEMQERWFHYIVDELLPRYPHEGRAMVTGCSMGGVHSGVFFFRRPDLFDTMIGLSGTYDAQHFFPGYMDDLIYNNSPIHFLPNMPQDHPWMDLYRQSTIITCCGQGAWEEDLLRGTRQLDAILTAKGIDHWSDYWGFDVNHDWPWWKKQLPYFMEHVMGQP